MNAIRKIALAVSAALVAPLAMAQATDPSAAITTVSTWFTGTLSPIVITFFGVVLVLFLGLKYTRRGASKG